MTDAPERIWMFAKDLPRNLEHWRQEVGKLHSQIDRLKHDRDTGAKDYCDLMAKHDALAVIVANLTSANAALAADNARLVKRGGEWIVIGSNAYSLRALSAASYAAVCNSGSDNPGFDMPGWFYTGSPYAAQIIGLGVSPVPIPQDFVVEYVPDLGKVWRSRRPLWEGYTTGAWLAGGEG